MLVYRPTCPKRTIFHLRVKSIFTPYVHFFLPDVPLIFSLFLLFTLNFLSVSSFVSFLSELYLDQTVVPPSIKLAPSYARTSFFH